MVRRLLITIALFACLPGLAGAQHFHQHIDAAPEDDLRPSPCTKAYAAPKLDAAIRKVHWKVSTTNAAAQAFFDQGITLIYGFNYEDAMRNFRKAKALDPTLAMASWGIALAAGPNINIAMEGPCGQVALAESGAALKLAEAQRPAGKITELEYAVVHALPPRYAKATIAPDAYALARRNVDYAVAMRAVWLRFRDANVSALFAESLMDLRPWALFNVAQQPAIDTGLIEQVLQQSIVREPRAVGANHYWIHAEEAGPSPGHAKPSADLLRTLVPGSGHLMHMPSHTYMLVGDYAAAFAVNASAIAVDDHQFAAACAGTYEQYTKNPDCLQLYYGHYGAHNLFFRSVAALFAGNRTAALENARKAQRHVQHFVAYEPGLQRYMTAPLTTLVANHDWAAVLREPEPPVSCYVQPPFTHETGCRILRSTWLWARAMADAATGNTTTVKVDYDKFAAEQKLIASPDPTGWGNNSAAAILAIADQTVLARIAWADGKRAAAIEHLKLAVTYEDGLVYDEPPQWAHPSRQSLGGALLAQSDYAGAARVFRDDLLRHPLNGRSLYGLSRALHGLGDPTWHAVYAQYRAAWKIADYTMSDAQLW